MLRTCHLYIDDKPYEFNVEGEFFWGEDKLLYSRNNSVLSNVEWRGKGYEVVGAFLGKEFEKFQKSVCSIIINALKQNKVNVDERRFKLVDYHKYVTNDELHNEVIKITRSLEVSDFAFDIDVLAKRFGKILDCELTSWVKELKKSHIQIRISRPNSLDINPPHRDGYLSYWKDIINIWMPIAGCNENSSLPILPSSHLLNENQILRTVNKGAKINNNTYYVPCILKTKKGVMQMVRPKVKEGEALLFTPFLIHGAAVNQNKDITRVSVELRFPRINL